MLSVFPFASYRPPPDRAAAVACPPYDVLTEEEARAIAQRNPASFVRVIRPEVDFPPGTDPHTPAVYARARDNLLAMLERGDLTHDSVPRIYAYQQRMGDHVQTGLVVCCSVDDYDEDRIKKHERTRKDKEDDRTNHALAVSAHCGPVFLTYRDVPDITDRTDALRREKPLYDITADDGVRHTVWAIDDYQPFVDLFARVPCAYVADGHHRAACASRVRQARRDANPDHTGQEEYNRFLAVLFPASQLRILPYNRLVRTLGGHSPESFLREIARTFDVAEAHRPDPDRPGVIGMYLAGRWYHLALPPDTALPDDPASRLDVSLLQERLIGPILGITDPRTDDRIEFVGGVRGTAWLEQAVDTGHAAAAFALYPVPIEALMAIADAGRIMPPKSTWFEPKLRSGLLVHPF